ncbi:MAG: PA2779 family protein [Nitrospirota bacterium]|jgi:hypothetical protein
MARKTFSLFLVGLMLSLSVAPRVEGAFTPSRTLALSGPERAEDLARVRTVLESKLVRERLSALGYDAGEVQGRLAGLSDAELHRLARRLEDAVPAGDAGTTVVTLLVVVLLVIVLLELTGHSVILR